MECCIKLLLLSQAKPKSLFPQFPLHISIPYDTRCKPMHMYITIYIRTPKRQTQMQKLPFSPFSVFGTLVWMLGGTLAHRESHSHLAECIAEWRSVCARVALCAISSRKMATTTKWFALVSAFWASLSVRCAFVFFVFNNTKFYEFFALKIISSAWIGWIETEQ